MSDDLEIRELTVAEQPASWQLGRLAFGGRGDPPADLREVMPGRTIYGAFDGQGRQIGKAMDRHHESSGGAAGWSRRRMSAGSR
ncbi:hypothetical protein [Fodinicola feengrottensis]|uniref:hypothetical protein n=1 Tax=Fodinicola feengrottensis TaxID=435914 RepID=UPI00244177D8|nr:hypothetical protein [Fodinicola feengrottensis]